MAAKVWKDGDIITAALPNSIEERVDNASAVGTTNESDIGDIYGIVNAIVNSTGAPALKDGIVKSASIAEGSVTLSKLAKDVANKLNSGGAGTQTGVVVTTFKDLKVGSIPVWNGGAIRSGVIELTNGAATPLTIQSNTAFVTQLKLKASMSFLVVDIKTAEPYTFETSASGAAITCTTDITVPAQSSLYLIVVE